MQSKITPSHIRNSSNPADFSSYLGKRQVDVVSVESGITQSLVNHCLNESHLLSHTWLSEHAVLVNANLKTSSLFKHT